DEGLARPRARSDLIEEPVEPARDTAVPRTGCRLTGQRPSAELEPVSVLVRPFEEVEEGEAPFRSALVNPHVGIVPVRRHGCPGEIGPSVLLNSLGPADVAEPIRIFILDHPADELRPVWAEPGEGIFDVLHGEHDAQVAESVHWSLAVIGDHGWC